MEALRKLLAVSRPVSWVNTAYPFAAAYFLVSGRVDATLIVGSLVFLIPYNLIMYGVNDVFDYESDMRNPRKGSLEGAREEKAFHPVILWACLMTGVLATAAFMVVTGDVITWFAYAAVLFFVLAYSLPVLRFKERPVVDSVTSSIHFVGPMIVGILAAGASLETYWPLIAAFFCWGMASHAFGAVQDIIPDRQGGLASIATVIGARPTVWLCALLYFIAVILVALQGGLLLIIAAAGLLYIANIAPYFQISDRTSPHANRGWRRFIWCNYVVGAIVTMVLIASIT